jgi:hypothetical protein
MDLVAVQQALEVGAPVGVHHGGDPRVFRSRVVERIRPER